MKALVVYGTKSGCTAQIAERIGDVLAEGGASVDVSPAQNAPAPEAYDAVVVGSGVRAGTWHQPVKAWLEAHAASFRERPVAFFTVGLTITDPEKADEVRAYTDPLVEATGLRPVDVGLFAGWFEPDRFSFAERTIMRLLKAPAGDRRDFDAIGAWTSETAPALGLE
jgi:menaquinone-dependent protoporphyrinogen oxidase